MVPELAPRRPLRAALSACGGIADLTLDAARRSRDFEIVALQDPDREALARVGERAGVARRHAEFAELLTDDVDFVILNGPNHVHLPQVRLAAAAGKACLVQKPMAPTLADAEAMVTIAAEHGVELGVTMFELGKPVHHQAKAMVASGWLGDPTLVQAVCAHDIYLRNPPPADDWRRDPRRVGGAAFIQLAIHQVNLVRWLLGTDPVAVLAVGSGGRTVFEEETTLATVRFGSGVLAQVAASYAASLTGVTLCGTRGRLHLLADHVVVQGEEPFEGEIFTYVEPGREHVIASETLAAAIERERDAVEVHGAFARRIRDGGEFWCTGEQALVDMRVVDAAGRSLRSGAWVELS